MTFSARARIKLSAIRHNLNVIQAIQPAAKVMAVIKGNAYGHGMLETAAVIAGADAFAVARLSEAVAVREAGYENALVLLGGIVAEADLALAANLGVSISVHNNEQIKWLENLGDQQFAVWVKVNTGMNRLGFELDQMESVIKRLQDCPGVRKLSLMTHFANADDPDDGMTARQIERFEVLTKGFDGDISIANSGGLFGFADELECFSVAGDEGRLWIRPGIALFGVSPIEGKTAGELGLMPAMQFESKLIACRSLQSGEPVGYGGEWRTSRTTTIGTIAVGYGDGYHRHMQTGTPVLINARTVPVVGVISMDLLAVDLGPNATDSIGDPVVLWGEGLPVETVAQAASTAAYQLVTGVTHREKPVFEQ